MCGPKMAAAGEVALAVALLGTAVGQPLLLGTASLGSTLLLSTVAVAVTWLRPLTAAAVAAGFPLLAAAVASWPLLAVTGPDLLAAAC